MKNIKLFEEFIKEKLDFDDVMAAKDKVVDVIHPVNILGRMTNEPTTTLWTDEELSDSFTEEEIQKLQNHGFEIHNSNSASISQGGYYLKLFKETAITHSKSSEYIESDYYFNIRKGRFGRIVRRSGGVYSNIDLAITDGLQELGEFN